MTPKELNSEKFYNKRIKSLRNYLVRVGCMINGIQYEKKIKYKKLINESNLEWDENKKYYIHSNKFKLRFATLLICVFNDNIEDIVERKFKKEYNIFTVRDYAYVEVYHLIEDIKRFFSVFLNNDNYGNILLKIHQDLIYMENKVNHKKYNEVLRSVVFNLQDGLKHTFLSDKKMDDDIAIDTIAKLAFMLSTGKMNFTSVPRFKENRTVDQNLTGYIKKLGKAIRNNSDYQERLMMYQAFNDASPLVMIINENKNSDFYIGVRSLVYASFICNDVYIAEFINKMIDNERN